MFNIGSNTVCLNCLYCVPSGMVVPLGMFYVPCGVSRSVHPQYILTPPSGCRQGKGFQGCMGSRMIWGKAPMPPTAPMPPRSKAPMPPSIAPPARLLRVPRPAPKAEEDSSWPDDEIEVDVVVYEEPDTEVKESDPVVSEVDLQLVYDGFEEGPGLPSEDFVNSITVSYTRKHFKFLQTDDASEHERDCSHVLCGRYSKIGETLSEHQETYTPLFKKFVNPAAGEALLKQRKQC